MQSNFTVKEIISRLTQYFVESDTEIKKEYIFADMSMKQIYYIDIINQLGRPTFSELTKALGLSKPSITAIVEKLVNAGYVRKEKSPEDKRSFYISLTEKGRRVCKMHDEMHERIIGSFRLYINDTEFIQLMSILNKITFGIMNEKGGRNAPEGE
ncbi:MAG: MarR family transcriptional regulator [Clostridia bacterium]|nr:MarR family transcriptional regulator [Clostridia bacterium]